MPTSDSGPCEVLDRLAEEFAARWRRGERPSLQEYIDRYPHLADGVRAVFPALVEMERIKEERIDPAAPATPAAPLPPLHQIGDYRLLREVGRGGMGVVYEAEQISLGRRVALKVLPLYACGDGNAVERFRREARAAAKLHHTNIVPVHEVGQDGDRCYYAMQFIQSQSLDQIIGELHRLRAQGLPGDCPPPLGSTTQGLAAPGTGAGGLRPAVDELAQSLLTGRFQADRAAGAPPASEPGADPSAGHDADTTSSAVLRGQTDLSGVRTSRPHYFLSVARIGWQTANALAHAHARGIVHRDIKPSNLLLDTAGVVWITDFGLAKTQDTALTTTGDFVGTLRYMAPERIRGEGDERADVYGLGLTLYELLVLRPAFDARDRLQLLDQIKNQEPGRPRVLDRSIPRDLETIVCKAMAKEAKRRYASAEALAEDLRRFLAGEPIKARRTGELERLGMWGRRKPALAALSASLLLLVVLVAAASTATALYLRATLAESETHRRHAEQAELEGKHELWRSYLVQTKARRMSRQPGQRFDNLRTVQGALALPLPSGRSRDELRTEAIAALCLPDLELAREGGREIVGAEGFAIDAAFQRYAIADKDGKVSIRRLSDDEELLSLPGGGLVNPYEGLQFSPDGHFLHQRCHVQRWFRSRLWDLDGPQPRAVLDDDHCNLTFRPDSRQCAASYPDRTVRFFDTASGRELRRFRVADMPPGFGVNWSPKLPQLLLWAGESLRLLNVDTGEMAAVGPKLASRHAWVAWHPDGRLLAVSDSDMKIHLWDIPAGRPALPPLEGHKANGLVMRFNHAGDRLLSTDWSGSWHLWDTRSGRLLLTLPAGGTILYFSPDDRLVGAGGDGKVQLFHFRRGEEVRTVVHRSTTGNRGYSPEELPLLDPEGRLCALRMYDLVEGVAMVDVVRGEEVALLPLPGNAPLRFDREGALWTYGSAGLLRWPVADDPNQGQRRYGPPQRILSTATTLIRGDAGLQVLAEPRGLGTACTLVLHRDGNRLLHLAPQEDVRFCAVSPDGRWVATGSHWFHGGAGAKVWDARAGKHVKDLPVGGSCGVQFSPDGKWLLTTSGGCRLWAVGTWVEGPKLGGTSANSSLNAGNAFSRDGKLLALGDAPGVVRLVGTDSGAEIARLTAAEPNRLLPFCFTADGAQLLTVGVETGALYVFDLRAIRAGLTELALDWDAPPLPAASARPAMPLSIHFELGDLLR
jgi:serine/threonine protein kinase/WD40 repeat protein